MLELILMEKILDQKEGIPELEGQNFDTTAFCSWESDDV